jgi:putative glutamine amidotransferase
MSLPLIGVTTSATYENGRERVFINAAYLRAVQGAGGVPVLLPPSFEVGMRDALFDQLTGLLLTGGGDIEPGRYGQTPHATVYDVSPERDALELWATREALARRRPVLAICRGLQVLNVALGGTLVQDISDEVGRTIAHSQPAPRQQATHTVKVDHGSRLADILGAVEVEVNSFHHQAVKDLGTGLRTVATAPDGVVEGLELPDAEPLVVGVQWHPEELVGHDAAARNLFAALVRAAAAVR